MMDALDASGFHVRLRWENTFDGDEAGCRLEQIFFVNDDQVLKARRFCSGCMIQLDATFNTNVLGMPLCNIVGVNHHGKTFTVALSFIRSEATKDFTFILDCLDELVFYGDNDSDAERMLPQVIITDQAAGFRKAIIEHPRCSQVFHQLCAWHMLKNIQAFIQRNRKHKEAKDLNDIWRAVWKLVECTEVGELPARRAEFYQLLEPCEEVYYQENWCNDGKEKRVLRAYTRWYFNLGLRSSSRNEGQNNIIKRFINHQMPLDQATRELIRTLAEQGVENEIITANNQLRRHLPNAAGMIGLRHLEIIITKTAIDILRAEMHNGQLCVDETKTF